MPFLEIGGSSFRNLKEYKLEPSPAINIISGQNGSGKTNLLEAIYLNGLGKSFRTGKVRNLIKDDEKSCVVFSHYQESYIADSALGKPVLHRIGVERRRTGPQIIKLDGEPLRTMAELARIVPMMAIQPNELDLIDGGSGLRRKYLDWLVFHVEHSFIDNWRDFQRLLKQRNSLLRKQHPQNASARESLRIQQSVWDKAFIESSLVLNEVRSKYCERLCDIANDYLTVFFSGSEQLDIAFEFYSGWDTSRDLDDILSDGYHQDQKLGYTKQGAHRADIVIKANATPAKDYLSRGQKKLLSMLMRLAQIKYFIDETQNIPVLMVDDLEAELDRENVEKFCQILEGFEAQIFITSLGDASILNQNFVKPSKLFHVKHGEFC